MGIRTFLSALQQQSSARLQAAQANRDISDATHRAEVGASIDRLSGSNTSLLGNLQDSSERISTMSLQMDYWNRVYYEDTRLLKAAYDELLIMSKDVLSQTADSSNAWRLLALQHYKGQDVDANAAKDILLSEQSQEWVAARCAWVDGIFADRKADLGDRLEDEPQGFV